MHAIREILMHDPMELARPAMIFAGVFAAGWLVRWLVLRALRAWTSRTGSRPGLILGEALRGPLLIWAVILAVAHGHPAFRTARERSHSSERACCWSCGSCPSP